MQKTLLLILFLLLASQVLGQQKKQYPTINGAHTIASTQKLYREFESKKDTVGMVYTAAIYLAINSKFDSLHTKSLPILILERHRVNTISERDYLLIENILAYCYIQGDYILVETGVEILKKTYAQAIKKNYPDIALESLLTLRDANAKLGNSAATQDKLFGQLQQFNQFKNEVSRTGLLYNLFMVHHHFKSNADSARLYCNKTYAIATKIQDHVIQTFGLLAIAQLERKKGEFEAGIQQAKMGLQLSREHELLDLERWAYQELALLYDEGKKDFKQATFYWKAYDKVIGQLKKTTSSESKVTLLNFKSIETELKATNQSLELAKLKQEKNMLFAVAFIVGLGFLLVVGFVFFIDFKSKLKQNQRKVAFDIQEKERRKISQELHDAVGSHIFAIKSYLFTSGNESKKISESLDFVYNKIRETSSLLNNQIDEGVGFNEACKDFVYLFSKSLKVSFGVHGLIFDIPQATASQLFRIIQEAFVNAQKHAEATQVNLEIFYENNEVIIKIEDDGKGFDINNIDQHGLGIKHIKERIKHINGNFELSSSPNAGTIYWISVIV